MALSLPSFERRLADYVEDRLFSVGVQASVRYRGEAVDLALGSGGPGIGCTPETIWRMFCMGKPVVAVAVALAAQDGLIELDVPVADQVDEQALRGNPATPRQLLDHTAGLHRLHGYGLGALSYGVRHEQVLALRPPPGWDPAMGAGYAEYAAWHLLGVLLEAATGEPVAGYLRREVTGPMAAGDIYFAMDSATYESSYEQLGVLYDLRGAEPVPLLANRNRRPCTDVNLAYGGYGTARGLARFYGHLLDVLAGRAVGRLEPETLAAFVGHRRGRRTDDILRRPCDFGLGFMVDLDGHQFEGTVSDAAFGHTGYFGTGVALADPAADLAVAIIWNGIVDGHLGVVARRNAALRALAEDLRSMGMLPDRRSERMSIFGRAPR